MTDLRTLAQAVVSAYEMFYGERNASVGRDYAVIDDCRARYYDACKAVEAALGLQAQSVDHASARAIITRLRAAEARTAWQPIETAPVDGDYVLICAPGWLAPVMAVHDGECWWMGNDAVSGATHWQPLPAAPEAPHG